MTDIFIHEATSNDFFFLPGRRRLDGDPLPGENALRLAEADGLKNSGGTSCPVSGVTALVEEAPGPIGG